jgi:hypothetical protein
MGFRLFRKTPEVTISVEGLRTSRGVFAANIFRIAEIPRAMAPRVMRIPSGAASALGKKLAGQKKFNTNPSAIVAAKIKGSRVITSGLSGRLSRGSVARKHRNNAGICKVARSKYAGSFGSLEPRKPGLELAKQRMIAGDETRSARARAIALNCRYGRGFQRGMVGEIEIIVAGKGEKAAAIARHPRSLFAQAIEKAAPQRGALQLLQFMGGKIIQGLHRCFGSYSRDNSAGLHAVYGPSFTRAMQLRRAMRRSRH